MATDALAPELTLHSNRIKSWESSSFYQNEGWRQNKTEQRSLVMEHIHDAIGLGRQVKYLGLPGREWVFENELRRKYPDSWITGFEANTRCFEYGVRFMPRGWRRRIFNQFRLLGNEHIDVWQDRRCYFFHADIRDFICQQMDAHTWRKQSRWDFLSRGYNAIWIDSFSPLGTTSIVSVLKHLRHVVSNTGTAFCLSFTVGRDSKDIASVIRSCPGNSAVAKRANFIRLVLKNNGMHFGVSKVFQHQSANSDGTLNIGTVCGIARLKGSRII